VGQAEFLSVVQGILKGLRGRLKIMNVSDIDEALAAVDAELERIECLIDLVVSCRSAKELCQRLVHDSFTQSIVKGAHVYAITDTLDIAYRVGYGRPSPAQAALNSAWEQESQIARAIREKRPIFEANSGTAQLALPLIIDRVPSACLLLLFEQSVTENPIAGLRYKMLTKIAAFFVEVMPTNNAQRVLVKKSEEQIQLNERHIDILQLAANGLKNHEIGKRLSLSESTVRQETIKIYKILGVKGRSEAVAHAKAALLIQ
jgi:DNA-binding CsgD family transcriptional regulator